MSESNFGKVTQVIGSTLDAQFAEDRMPKIYNALEVEVERTVLGLIDSMVNCSGLRCHRCSPALIEELVYATSAIRIGNSSTFAAVAAGWLGTSRAAVRRLSHRTQPDANSSRRNKATHPKTAAASLAILFGKFGLEILPRGAGR